MSLKNYINSLNIDDFDNNTQESVQVSISTSLSKGTETGAGSETPLLPVKKTRKKKEVEPVFGPPKDSAFDDYKKAIKEVDEKIIPSSLKNLLELFAKDIIEIKHYVHSIAKVYNEQTSRENIVNGHVELLQKLINERITPEHSESSITWSEPVPLPPVSHDPTKKKKLLFLKFYNESYMKLYGNGTFDYKPTIKKIKGVTWNNDEKAWLVPVNEIVNMEVLFSTEGIPFTKE